MEINVEKMSKHIKDGYFIGEHNDTSFLDTYVRAMTEQMNAEMETTIINYLIQNGYMAEGEDVLAVAARLEEQGQCIRCEQFVKFNPDAYTATAVFVPFVDAIDSWTSRADVYRMCRLKEQGYSL